MKKFRESAFTLVELLIVIGIIGILAVTLLLTLNPAEAQKKSRDAKRIKDAQTIQSALEQYLLDGNNVSTSAPDWTAAVSNVNGTVGTTSINTSMDGDETATNGQSCGDGQNWLGVDMCDYIKTVPTDPNNNLRRTCANGAGDPQNGCYMFYSIRFSGNTASPGSDYEINVRQESQSNAEKLNSDGGDQATWFEVLNYNIADLGVGLITIEE